MPLHRLFSLCRNLMLKNRVEQDLSDELKAYRELLIEKKVKEGLDPVEARRGALMELGGVEQVKERVREVRTGHRLETLWQDVRYGLRLLRLNPGFAAVALLSLALGIGANTAIFQLLNALHFRMLPVHKPEQLASVQIRDRSWKWGAFRGPYSHLTNPLWEQIRRHQQAFSGLFAWTRESFNLNQGGEVRYADGLWVSGDFFQVLGVSPLLGRVFTAADDQRGCRSPGAVISYSFWQSEFGGNPAAVGSLLSIQGRPFEIIGVTPASFFGVEVGQRFDFAIPLCSEPILRGEATALDERHVWWLAVAGRLKPDWTLERASSHLSAISPALLEETIPPVYTPDRVERYLQYRLGALPGGSGFSLLRESFSRPLQFLIAIAGLVLLIACANLANLMLARAGAREREIVVRLALGASRTRLIRQLLVESLLLAAGGALAGVFLARALSRFLVSFLSTKGDPLFVELAMDWRVLAFTAGLAILACLLFGLTPALRATRVTAGSILRAGSRGMTASRERLGLRRALVVSQVALSCLLLISALLFVRSLHNLMTVDVGFSPDGILIASLNLSALNLPKERRHVFKQDLIGRVRALPGVQSAASSFITPISGSYWGNQKVLIGGIIRGTTLMNEISADYFTTLEIPLLAGRDFDDRDTLSSPTVAIVNELFVERFLNGTDPLGAVFQTEAPAGEPQPAYEIVGLVKNTKYADLRDELEPITYLPASQDEDPSPNLAILLRISGSVPGLLSSVKAAVAEVNPAISIRFQVLEAQIRGSLLRERLMAMLSAFFGALAMLLATIGLYGVISYMVVQRRKEIGIRIALGARRPQVIAMVMKEAGMLLAVGLTVGLGLALAAGQAAAALLFGLRPSDPLTLFMAAASLAAVAGIASYLPARRAAALEPTAVLREE
ncbi:MAG: ADOP family duplicated permease [Acidobacteriota bacterium]